MAQRKVDALCFYLIHFDYDISSFFQRNRKEKSKKMILQYELNQLLKIEISLVKIDLQVTLQGPVKIYPKHISFDWTMRGPK